MIAALANRPWVAGLLLAGLTLAAYSNAAPRAFVFDDAAVLHNPALGGVATVPKLFAEPARPRTFLYRPLSMASLAVDRSLYGPDPRGYHATNIALHVFATIAVFALLQSLALPAALFGAAVFGVHPIHTEAVDVAFNRSELLATLFVTLALLALLRWSAERPLLAYASASLLYFFALLSRESGVTLPVLATLVLLVGRPQSDRDLHLRSLSPLLALLAPLALYLWMRSAVFGPSVSVVDSVMQGMGYQSFPERLGIVATTFRDYWRMMVWPWPLRATCEDYVVSGTLGAVALHVAILAMAVALRRRFPGVLLGVVFFYVALLPSSKLMAYPAWLAERFTYLPSVGFVIVVASLAHLSERRIGRWPAAALYGVLIAVLALVTLTRNRDWQSPTRLWEAEVRHAPRDWMALLNLSQIYLDSRRLDEVVDLCQRGSALAPQKSTFASNAGIALVGLGRSAEAEAEFRRAVLLSDDPADHANLARFFVVARRLPEAEEAYAVAASREPNPAAKHALRGEMFLQCRKDADAAAREYEAALALAPHLRTAIEGLRMAREAGTGRGPLP